MNDIVSSFRVGKGLRFLLATGAGIAAALLPLPLEPLVQKTLAVTVAMMLLFILEPVPLAVSGLLGCLGFTLLKAQPFAQSFSGFSQTTTWYIFGALLLGTAVTKSGLAMRLACHIIRVAGSSFSQLLAGALVLNFVLTFVVPSGIARVVILCSICAGLMEALGQEKGSNIGKSLFAGVTFAAALFDKGILGGGTALLSRELIARFTGHELLYSQWLILFVPFDAVIIVMVWYALMRLFPPERMEARMGTAFAEQRLRELGPLTPAEKRTLLITGLTLAAWMTDFAHGVNPGLIGIMGGLLVTLPRIGVLDEEDIRKTNFLMVIFVGAALSLGAVLIETHTASVLAHAMFNWLIPFLHGESPLMYGALFVYNFVLHLLMGDELGVIAATMPAVLQFAQDIQVNVVVTGLLWTYATGAKVFIYQSGPLVAGYAFGFFSTRDMFKLGALITAVELLMAMLLPYWWKLFI